MNKWNRVSALVAGIAVAVVLGCGDDGKEKKDDTTGGGNQGVEFVTGGSGMMTSENFQLMVTSGNGPGANRPMQSGWLVLKQGLISYTQ